MLNILSLLLLVGEAGIVSFLPGTRIFPHLTVGVDPLGEDPLVAPRHWAAHVVHAAVVVLGRVHRQPEQGGASLRADGQAEAGEDSPAALPEVCEVAEEGGYSCSPRPLVVRVPVVNMDLYLSSEAVVNDVVLVTSAGLLIYDPACSEGDPFGGLCCEFKLFL